MKLPGLYMCCVTFLWFSNKAFNWYAVTNEHEVPEEMEQNFPLSTKKLQAQRLSGLELQDKPGSKAPTIMEPHSLIFRFHNIKLIVSQQNCIVCLMALCKLYLAFHLDITSNP